MAWKAWRKVHVGTAIWEWRVGGRMLAMEDHYVLIRSPSKVVRRVSNYALFRSCDMGVVTPGIVKEYIVRNRSALMRG